LPLVVWGDPISNVDYTVVGSNNKLGGYLATKHLIDNGCKNIVFLGDPEHIELAERNKGYRQALSEGGMAIEDKLTLSIDITSMAAYEKISETILHHGLFFDGIVASSDMIALGAIKALKERYIGIPSEVAIVGFDDIAMAELFHPSLTTIRQNIKKATETMVNQLMRQIEGKQSQSTVIDIELIPRKSTRH
jgi:DNA-binding LacI/PurR family transcriptional regulator